MSFIPPPDTTIQLKFRIVLEDNSEVVETVDLEITNFFDGITMDINETSYYPFNDLLSLIANDLPPMEVSFSGNTLTGKIDKQDFYLKYDFHDSYDSSHIYSTKCDFNITFDGNQVSGSQHFEYSAKCTERRTVGWDNTEDEYEYIEDYTFSSQLDKRYKISATSYPTVAPNYYEFEIRYKNIKGDYSWKKVYWNPDEPDSTATHSGQFQSDKYSRNTIFFSGYLN
jgi:hypothetical protein